MNQQEQKTALIVVRTYPVPDALGIESSCTAAITDRGEWLRLFPVPWRLLNKEQQFRKYQWVRVNVIKAREDTRPESYHLRPDGIEVLSRPLSTADSWKERKDIVLPLETHSLCRLSKLRDAQYYPTLGIVHPASISRLRISPSAKTEWTQAELDMLHQQHLFADAPKRELEKIPFVFRYEFRCSDTDCSGHTMMCTDWEMSESYRRWRVKYGEGWQAKFRQRYEEEMIRKFDTHFFVGTVASHPNAWIIIGLFRPPRYPDAGQTAFSF